MYRPITEDDSIVVRGKHLYKRDGTPFKIYGIAFPTPPDRFPNHGYNAVAWLDVLKQLRELMPLQFNAVRVYRMNPLKVE